MAGDISSELVHLVPDDGPKSERQLYADLPVSRTLHWMRLYSGGTSIVTFTLDRKGKAACSIADVRLFMPVQAQWLGARSVTSIRGYQQFAAAL